MRFIIQRVNQASSTSTKSQESNKIGMGLLVYVGFNKNDTKDSLDPASEKLLNAKLFDGEKETRWKESVLSLKLEIKLVLNQTLYCNFNENEICFDSAMDEAEAQKLLEELAEVLIKKYDKNKISVVKDEQNMLIDSINDGPVTIDYECNAENNKSGGDSKQKNNKKNKGDKKGKDKDKDK